MPLYEYRCEECRRRFTLLVGVTAEGPSQACPGCGGNRLRKLISRFAIARSEESVLDDLSDPSGLGDPEDPRAMADWMRRVGREMGEDMDDDFEELVEEAVREEMTGGPGDASLSDGGGDADLGDGGSPSGGEGGALSSEG
jgi:putative FmdB family regulatory protein